MKQPVRRYGMTPHQRFTADVKYTLSVYAPDVKKMVVEFLTVLAFLGGLLYLLPVVACMFY